MPMSLLTLLTRSGHDTSIADDRTGDGPIQFRVNDLSLGGVGYTALPLVFLVAGLLVK